MLHCEDPIHYQAEHRRLKVVISFLPLPVSCPNDDNSVQILFCPFLCSIWIFLCFECVVAEKTAKFCLEFTFFHLLVSFVLEF